MVWHFGQGQKWTQAFEGIDSDVRVPQCGQVRMLKSSAMALEAGDVSRSHDDTARAALSSPRT